MIELSIDGVEAATVEMVGSPKKVSRAIVRALNRSISSARTVVVRDIANDIGLKQKDVREALVMKTAFINEQAGTESVEVSLAASKRRLPLLRFNARGPEPSRGKGRGVSYRIGKVTKRLPHAFIATMPSKKRGVFERIGKERLPIGKEKRGPSLGRVFLKYRQNGVARANEVFEKNFAAQLNYELNVTTSTPLLDGDDA